MQQNELIGNKNEKITYYAATITGCVSISVFASLIGIPVSAASSVPTVKIFVITAGIKVKIISKKN